MKRLLLYSLLPLTFASAATVAQPVARIEVSEIRTLLVRAAAEGSAYGMLTGVGAEYLRSRFASNSPVEIDVRSLHALPQPGCGRLEVTTRQRDVIENGQREDKVLVYELSFCRDGSLPEKP